MCGIVGIISSNRQSVSQEKIKQMSDKIAHRGPDGEGYWINDAKSVAFGHRRLSIIDLSDNAAQPFHYLNRYTMVFNGEIYNYPEIKKTLVGKGYSFKTNSDTEVLLALYDLKKHDCFADIDGMFSFAIWDEKEQELFCARDRFGEKPFYYYHGNDLFCFASEMKALWAAGIDKTPKPSRVFLYLAYGLLENITAPSETFFENIHQLEPAHYMVVKSNRIVCKKKYWDLDITRRDVNITFHEAKEQFLDLFKNSVSRRLRSDVPVGSSLSGGLDSSSIVAIINKIKTGTQSQKTFSARFENYEKDEGKFIKLVTDQFGLDSHSVFLTPEILIREIDKVFYYQEEPFGSTSVIAQWRVMQLAREFNVTVLLDGQGADEILAGYPKFFNNYFSSLILSAPKRFKVQTRKFTELHGTKPDYIKLLFSNLFPKGRNILRKGKNKIFEPTYYKQFDRDFLQEAHTTFNYEFFPDLNAALYNELSKGPLSNLLRYADRNSMANGREVRLPFLEHKLAEFVFSLPDEFKLNEGWTKYILRDAMRGSIPDEICDRKEKVGFEPPLYNQINGERVTEAKRLLVSNNILNKNAFYESRNWEYLQASMLFEK